MASIAGVVGIRDRLAYSTTKFAVVGITKSMALDHAAEGIRPARIAAGQARDLERLERGDQHDEVVEHEYRHIQQQTGAAQPRHMDKTQPPWQIHKLRQKMQTGK